VAGVTDEKAPDNSDRVISDYEAYLFGEGTWLKAWEKMASRFWRKCVKRSIFRW
jgi:hypothetical protein